MEWKYITKQLTQRDKTATTKEDTTAKGCNNRYVNSNVPTLFNSD